MASRPNKRQKKVMRFGPKSQSRPAAAVQIRPVDVRKDDQSVVDTSHNEKICVLCCEEIDIIAKGSCDHIVCFKCSSRMRVLCQEKYCAVCRMDLSKVAFINNNVPFKDLDLKAMSKISKHGIFFQNEQIKNLYEELLFYACSICTEKTNFGSFAELRRHVRQVHDKQYCDLCAKNLKIFPKDLRVYTRSELVAHRKTGDVDDKSHKGHPQCEFCSERYLDDDELANHLRKYHFWCHFCEKDGKQDYFANYDYLREHFGEEHFLCEEGECTHEKFTSVFRSDIDFQAHKIAKHSKKMTKIAAKQARQLNVDIDYGTRKAQRTLAERRIDGDQRKYGIKRDARNDRETDLAGESNSLERNETTNQERPQAAESQNSNRKSFQNDFPTLKEDAAAVSSGKNFPLSVSQAVVSAIGPSASETVASASGTVASASGTVSSAADVLKGKTTKKSAEKDGPRSTEPGNLSWSKFSSRINLRCEDAFPCLDSGISTKQVTNCDLSYKNATTVQKSDARIGSGTKKKSNRHENQAVVKKVEAPLERQKSKSPPGLKKTDAKSQAAAVKSVPPGISKQSSQQLPPGIALKSKTSVNTNGMPPGINKNINGRPQNITKSTQERNLELVELIRRVLNADDYDKFKDLSGSFRRSEITASQYYDCIAELLGYNLESVFFELVDLLPDKSKQEQLLSAYNFRFDSKKVSNGKDKDIQSQMKDIRVNINGLKCDGIVDEMNQKGIKKATNEETIDEIKKKEIKRVINNDVILCKICGISLSKKESKTHMDIHAENDFPGLPVAVKKPQPWQQKQPKNVKSAWGKLK